MTFALVYYAHFVIWALFPPVKWKTKRDFQPPVFFPHSNQPGPLTIGLKYF